MGERPSVKPWMRPQPELKANPRLKAYLRQEMPVKNRVQETYGKGWTMLELFK
jgi:hypothetical protein